uniref:Uncharacterized protein n=1 Tax=Fagus sylvatica TaxID=28930 RepID=A0A2N9IKM3_FAGSY
MKDDHLWGITNSPNSPKPNPHPLRESRETAHRADSPPATGVFHESREPSPCTSHSTTNQTSTGLPSEGLIMLHMSSDPTTPGRPRAMNRRHIKPFLSPLLRPAPNRCPFPISFFVLQVFHPQARLTAVTDFPATSVGAVCGKRVSAFITPIRKDCMVRTRSMEVNAQLLPSSSQSPEMAAMEKQVRDLTANLQELTRQNHTLNQKLQQHETEKEKQRDKGKSKERGDAESRQEQQHEQQQEHRQEQEDETKGEHTRVPYEESSAKWEQEIRAMKAQLGEMKDEFKGKGDQEPGHPRTQNGLPIHRKGVPDEIMCRAFPTTLKGPARIWFKKLIPGSVGSFAQLSHSFFNHFIGGQRCGRPTTHLLNVRQREGETLRSYLTRFNKETLLVDGADDKVVLTAFISGLQSGDFLFSVYKDPPTSMSEMMYEAQRYMNGEDALQARDTGKKRRNDYADRPNEALELKPKTQRNQGKKREDRNRRGSNERFNHFTPLNAPVDRIFMQIKDDPALRWPGKLLTNPDRRAKDKYCRFHRDHGHNTDDCYDLKRQIEELIKQGKLQRFVERDQREGRPPQARPQRPPVEDRPRPSMGEIHMINGGMAAGGTSRSSRKAYARQIHNVLVTQKANKTPRLEDLPITFTEEDARKVVHPHDDAFGCHSGNRSHEDMPGISTEVMIHKLNVNPSMHPIKQKRRVFAPERNAAVMAEVDKLLTAGFIREVYYPEWLANVVMVKKPNGKWRMCVDFTDLNKACPKDSYPLPRIDQLVDSTAGHKLLSFMDAFSGYNQIRMEEEDQEKTAFITSRGLFCYKVMPFGLKNAGATYQRLVNKMFHDQIGRNVEVYVDDMLVKSKENEDHLKDLKETFQALRTYNMKLNPEKCAFGVSSGKFLGFMVSQRGIEANPDKIKAILEMSPPTTVKEVQSLTGKAAALNRFVSRSTDKVPPLLQAPQKQAKSCIYTLAISSSAVSSALIREEERVQKPVYYTSRALKGAEERYSNMEKLAFALLIASRKLRPYFQAHSIVVLTDYPLRKAMNKPDAAGRLIQWSIEMSEFDIDYRPRTAIKAQALADFIAEVHAPMGRRRKWVEQESSSSHQRRINSSMPFNYASVPTNNEAEYEALLAGLKLSKKMGVKNLTVKSDSQLVVGQVKGEYEAREDRMKKYLKVVQTLLPHFQKVEFVQIPREENVDADRLARLASSGEECDGFLEILGRPSSEEETVNAIKGQYLVDVTHSPLLKGREEEANYVIREVHEGICGNHSGARALAHKLTRAGYYWPSLLHDATQYVKTCDKCQRFANIPRAPPEEITPMTSPWPFAQWGLDIMGPFPVGTKQAKFLVGVICRFGIPRVLVSDNGKQFDNGPFRDLCAQLNIKNHYSSPRHPQANGQVEVTNRTLLKQIKTRLEGAKGMWVEELPSILWAYRTTVRVPTGETPFKLTFGTEAVIPVEIGLTTLRTTFHKEEENEGQLRLNLDLLDETRDKAARRITLYQEKMAKYYNTKVKLRRFEIGDWVLRKITQATKDPSQGKLGPNWEGPYKVIQYYRRGTYHLEDRHGKKLPSSLEC